MNANEEIKLLGRLRCDVCKHEFGFTSYVCDDCKRELRKKSRKPFNLGEEIRNRSDYFALPMFLFFSAGTSYLLVEDHGWSLPIFIFLLENIIFELAYRISQNNGGN